MPRFLILLRSQLACDLSQRSPDDYARILAAYAAWGEAMQQQGRLLGGDKLRDDEGVQLHRAAGGDTEVRSGPCVADDHVVSGYHLIEADDLQHAARLCQEHPDLEFGGLEIRQLDEVRGPTAGGS